MTYSSSKTRVRFVRNSPGIRDEILLSEGEVRLLERLVAEAERVAPPGCRVVVDRSDGRSARVRVRIVSDDWRVLHAEAVSGLLTRALAQVRV